VGDILHVAPPSGDSSAGHTCRLPCGRHASLARPGGDTPRLYIAPAGAPPDSSPRSPHSDQREGGRERPTEGGREGGEEATRFFQFLSVFTDCCSALWIDVVAIHVLLMAKNNLTLYGSGDVVLNLGTYFFSLYICRSF
jgi:hypothetical protein